MTYICLVDNIFINSCNLIISDTIIDAHIILKVSPVNVKIILDNMIIHLVSKGYNIKGYLQDNNFYYDCINEIVPFLQTHTIDYKIIDKKKCRFLCC